MNRTLRGAWAQPRHPPPPAASHRGRRGRRGRGDRARRGIRHLGRGRRTPARAGVGRGPRERSPAGGDPPPRDRGGSLRGVTGGAAGGHAWRSNRFLVLVLGCAPGGGGRGVGRGSGGRTVGREPSSALGVTVLPAVALIVVVGLVAVLVGMAGALREPLADQVSVAERPRPVSTAALFGSVLLLVAAVVATYRSSVVDAADPGWVVLAGPALVGTGPRPDHGLGGPAPRHRRGCAGQRSRRPARRSWPPGASPGWPRRPPRSGFSWRRPYSQRPRSRAHCR